MSPIVSASSLFHARRPLLVGFALALLAAVLFSAKAIVVKLAYRYPVDAVTLLALRMVLSLPCFALAAWWSRRNAHAPLARGDWLRIGVLGLTGYYLASFLDFLGLQYIGAGLERLILFLYPTLVMLMNVWWLKRSVSRAQWVALVVSYVGIAVVFAHDVSIGGTHVALGSALVFASAVSYAVYLFSSGELVQRVGTIRLTAYATIVAAVLCIAQFAITHRIDTLVALPAGVWALSAINALFCTVIPVFATMAAIARIGAASVSITGMIGPVSTLALAAIALQEPITPIQVVGTVFVLAGVFLATRAGRR
ncbi:MAG TPA: DMT family transporter [Burkholderiaceae bacterium]|nr:DMT family transporter [Burkholderiaceae bacterium]